ncbi:hypothetical protein QBC43DRAFT_344342 [Cladorrhinum sp. PSN259]|nr:hypothetical protein QBC43DRAFT_344342 [Cladorrhinum sp. PSN259]
MDGRTFPLGSSQHGAPALPERPSQSSVLAPVSEMPPQAPSRGMERLSTTNLRGTFRSGIGGAMQQTVRVVTPEPADVAFDTRDRNKNGSGVPQLPRGIGSVSPQSLPRTIPGASVASVPTAPAPPAPPAPARRQGLALNDPFPASSFDSSSTTPPLRQSSFRPRTHTMDGAFRQQLAPAVEARHRVGSFSSSLPTTDDLRLPTLQSPLDSSSPTSFSCHNKDYKDKKSSSGRSRLTKRPSSRPSSPLLSLPPSVDSLPLPIPTADANRVLLLMKNLCGRMRGEIEYQKDGNGLWRSGICYIEEEKGSLMFDPGDNGPFHTALVSDLRGCRVIPTDCLESHHHCLEITTPQLNGVLLLRPIIYEELDLWLAALLCWQQLRPAVSKQTTNRPGQGTNIPVREMTRRASSSGLRDAAIIKFGRVMIWDKGVATSPRAIVKRPSTRDLRSSQTSWRRVSCILHDNGELKLMTENDVHVLSVIELPQLARSAIQLLDKSVLDEDYCLAIFPIYSSTSTQLSIFRPLYIALESRVLFEVWFVLLRAFTVPDIYNLDPPNGGQVCEVTDLHTEPPGETFRLEKTIHVRVTEAKFRGRTMHLDGGLSMVDRHGKPPDHDILTGNYLAEVILDGEVRARTTTKMDTKKPFWREDCEFVDLPASLPYLSILLKRVDGGVDSFAHQLQATLGLAKAGSITEVLCGSVDIPLHQLDRGKDHEQWFQICDERQQSVGSMLVKVHHEELVVLLSKHYQPLSDLLHRFSSGLTAQITEALPGSLRRVAEIFLNIFQVSGSANEWLQNMVEEEIDGVGTQATLKKPRFSNRLKSNESLESTSDREQLVRDMNKSLQGEANLLFRGNSLLTQALEFHMRRLGKEYLMETLADKIYEINELNPNCEVDPSKLQHGDDPKEHWNLLIELTNELWDCIATSANRLPVELRQILKYIRAVADDRYGDFLRTVTYTSVSGFLFLRFLCPAILNPKLFGLLRDHPRPRAQRALTLITKGIQALGNLSTIGKKETWMEPMNRFLSAQRQSFKDFLDAVCAVPAGNKVAFQASYSTPMTIMGRLPPIAREGFPSLPYLLESGRNFAALVKLWMDAHPGETAHAYQGDLLQFHRLCVDLHQRSGDCYARIESLRAAEMASQMADDRISLTDALDRISLGDTINISSYSSSTVVWGMESESGRPPGSSGSEMEGSIDTLSPGGNNRDTIRFGSHNNYPNNNHNNNRGETNRQVSRSSEMFGSQGPGGTVRAIRNGIHPRKLLSGFIRKTRTAGSSPDEVLSSGGGSGAMTTSSSSASLSRDREELLISSLLLCESRSGSLLDCRKLVRDSDILRRKLLGLLQTLKRRLLILEAHLSEAAAIKGLGLVLARDTGNRKRAVSSTDGLLPSTQLEVHQRRIAIERDSESVNLVLGVRRFVVKVGVLIEVSDALLVLVERLGEVALLERLVAKLLAVACDLENLGGGEGLVSRYLVLGEVLVLVTVLVGSLSVGADGF